MHVRSLTSRFTQRQLVQDLHKLGVQEGDLLHMDNTVQMHKPVPQACKWRSVVFVHEQWKQRLYYLPPEETGVKERLRAKQVCKTSLCCLKTPGMRNPEGLLDQYMQQLYCVQTGVTSAKHCLGAKQRCWTYTLVRCMLALHLS